jgi:hypothetical protein
VRIVVGEDLRAPFFFSLSILFEILPIFPALRNIHEAPRYFAVLLNKPACDAPRLRRLESSQIALFWGLACGVARWRSAC